MNKPDWYIIKYATNSDGYKYNGIINGPKGLVVHSTAMPGYDSNAMFDNFNVPKRGASIHGCLDNNQFIQMMPFTQKAGHVGSGKNGTFNSTHLGIELCEPKGIVYNKKTWEIESYNPPKGYFESIWDKATTLYALLCKEYNINPLQHDANGGIVGHFEAHALGYGDNHGDPSGWFAWEGVTMDDFRKDVYNKINNIEDDTMTYEQFKEYMNMYLNEATTSDPSTWAKTSCEKAINKGIVLGDGNGAYNWQKPLTREAYLVMQDRAGLL